MPWDENSGLSPEAKHQRMRRARTVRMTNGRCFYCGDPLFHKGLKQPRDWLFVRPHQKRMVQEHMTPVSRNGASEHANYVPACAACNWDKGQLNLAEYRFVCGLRAGHLGYRFAAEHAPQLMRDWLICATPGDNHTALLIHNIPAARAGVPRRRPTNSGWRHAQ